MLQFISNTHNIIMLPSKTHLDKQCNQLQSHRLPYLYFCCMSEWWGKQSSLSRLQAARTRTLWSSPSTLPWKGFPVLKTFCKTTVINTYSKDKTLMRFLKISKLIKVLCNFTTPGTVLYLILVALPLLCYEIWHHNRKTLPLANRKNRWNSYVM